MELGGGFHPSSRILKNTENSFTKFDYVDGKFTTHLSAMDSSVAYGYNLLYMFYGAGRMPPLQDM